jgi:hypothetical protein
MEEKELVLFMPHHLGKILTRFNLAALMGSKGKPSPMEARSRAAGMSQT